MSDVQGSTVTVKTDQVDRMLTALDHSLAAIPVPTLIELSADHFDNRGKRAVQLIGNHSADKAFSSKREWIGYEFKGTQFVSRVVVRGIGFSEYDEMELSYEDAFTKQPRILYSKNSDGEFSFEVGNFTEGFGIRPPSKYIKSASITGIDVYAATGEQLALLVKHFIPVSTLRDKIGEYCNGLVGKSDNAKTKLAELESVIVGREEKIKTLDDQIAEINAQSIDLNKQLLAKQQELEERGRLICAEIVIT